MKQYEAEVKAVLEKIKSGKLKPAEGYDTINSIKKQAQSSKTDTAHGKNQTDGLKESGNGGAFKALIVGSPQTVDAITLSSVTPREPGYNEVQVIVKAAALNFSDLLCVKGMYQTMPPYPFVPGSEFSGIVAKIGGGVSSVKQGDAVICIPDYEMGGHSMISTLNANRVYKMPDNCTFEEACAYPVAFMTSYHVLELAKIKAGDKVLIQSAAGGTGHIMVQIALLRGAEVFATCGSDEKFDFLYSLGVHHCINYLNSDFEKEIMRMTGNRGVDVVVNTLAGDNIQKGINILAHGGRYIEMAMVGMRTKKYYDLSGFTDNQTFCSIDLRRLIETEPELWGNYVKIMLKSLKERKIRPIVTASVPFEKIREAYRLMDQRKVTGKIVVTAQTDDSFPKPDIAKPRRFSGMRNDNYNRENCDIAVIGVSCRFAGAKNKDELWKVLETGKCTISEVPENRWSAEKYYSPDQTRTDRTNCKWGGFLENIDKFDPMFFNMSGREAELTDPQQRVFLQEAWSALEDAGYAGKRAYSSDTGVFLGIGYGDYQEAMLDARMNPEAESFWGNACSASAGRVSYFLNLSGPSISIDTACSSSLVAVHMACRSIINGECEMALAGGVFIMVTPKFYIMSSNAGMLSPTGRLCAFSENADGFVPGEGAGAVVLKPLQAAIDDGDNIYGVIKGSGVNHDGRTNGLTAPSAVSQEKLETSVYKRFGINPETVSYAEAHGTGTPLGDPIEIDALTNAFGRFTKKKNFCAVGSVKTNIGHCSMAAGVGSVIKVLLSLKHNKIPATLNFDRSNHIINFEDSPFYVNTSLKDWEKEDGKPRRAVISSFGFSGTNAHIVVEEAPEVKRKGFKDAARWNIVPLSAKTPLALKKQVENLRNWLDDGDDGSRFDDVCFTLQQRREHFAYRVAFAAQNKTELKQAIDTAFDDGNLSKMKYGKVKSSRNEAAAFDIEAENLLKDGIDSYEKAKKLAKLYTYGAAIDWRGLENVCGRTVSMPTYPFEEETYWIPAENIEKEEKTETGYGNPRVKNTDDSILHIFYNLQNGGLQVEDAQRLLGGIKDEQDS